MTIRAQRRLIRSHSKRREEALYLTGRRKQNTSPFSLPPIEVQKIPPGWVYGLTVSDIRNFLEVLGPVYSYGLQRIVLGQVYSGTSLVFGEYRLPGIIYLFATPKSPWRFPFIPAPKEIAVLQQYMQVELDLVLGETTLTWTATQLREFYRWQVLAHELGHHHLQRKHNILHRPICRQGEHEQGARLYSQRIRQHIQELSINV